MQIEMKYLKKKTNQTLGHLCFKGYFKKIGEIQWSLGPVIARYWRRKGYLFSCMNFHGPSVSLDENYYILKKCK